MQNNKLDIIGKKIHSHKSVIAMYAKYCIDEFKDMDLDAIQL